MLLNSFLFRSHHHHDADDRQNQQHHQRRPLFKLSPSLHVFSHVSLLIASRDLEDGESGVQVNGSQSLLLRMVRRGRRRRSQRVACALLSTNLAVEIMFTAAADSCSPALLQPLRSPRPDVRPI